MVHVSPKLAVLYIYIVYIYVCVCAPRGCQISFDPISKILISYPILSIKDPQKTFFWLINNVKFLLHRVFPYVFQAIFGMDLLHSTLPNGSRAFRLSCDTRWQPLDAPPPELPTGPWRAQEPKPKRRRRGRSDEATERAQKGRCQRVFSAVKMGAILLSLSLSVIWVTDKISGRLK